MATIHSLVCWGGRTGKTVTLSNANPCVFTSTNNGLRTGTGLVFSTTGSLPTGLTVGTTYYVRSLGASTCNLYETAEQAITGGTTGRIATTSAGSGTHTAKSKIGIDYLAAPPTSSRWGASSSERCYDGIGSFVAGRSGASNLNTEVCELAEGFTETATSTLSINVPSAALRIESKVNGVRTSAFHYGNFNTGFNWYQSVPSQEGLFITSKRAILDGFTASITPSWYEVNFINATSGPTLQYMIILGPGGYTTVGGTGNGSRGNSSILHSIIAGFLRGIFVDQYSGGRLVGNNFVTKCGTGFYPNGTTLIYGEWFNNISVGNTTNWGTASGFDNAKNNAGLTGEAWLTSGTRLTIATTDVVTYPSNLRPAAISSPQVEMGLEYYGILSKDIAGNPAPNYVGSNSGVTITAGSFVVDYAYTIASVGTTDFTLIGATANTVGLVFRATGVGSGTGTAVLTDVWDAGPYEFDHSFGLRPETATVTFTDIAAGSEIRVYDSTGAEIAGIESCSANQALSWSIVGTTNPVNIKIVNVLYKIKDFFYTSAAGEVSLPSLQEVDNWYKNPV